MKKSEERIQFEIVQWFRNNYCLNHHDPKCLIFSVPNDGKNMMEQMRKKSTGLLAGASDLIVVLPNRIIFVEVKDEKGTQQPNQKQFQADVEKLGFEYIVVRSLTHFSAHFSDFLGKMDMSIGRTIKND